MLWRRYAYHFFDDDRPVEAQDVTLTPDPVAVPLAVPAPSLTVTLTPAPVAIPLTVPAPAVAVTLEPDPVAVPVVVPAPSLTVTVAPDPVAVPLTVPAPTVEVGLSPDPVAVPLVVPAPALQVTLAPDPVTIPLVIPAPTVVADVTLTPDPVVVQLTIPAPTITVTGVPAPPTAVPGITIVLDSGRPYVPPPAREPAPIVERRAWRLGPVALQLRLPADVRQPRESMPMPSTGLSARFRVQSRIRTVERCGGSVVVVTLPTRPSAVRLPQSRINLDAAQERHRVTTAPIALREWMAATDPILWDEASMMLTLGLPLTAGLREEGVVHSRR